MCLKSFLNTFSISKNCIAIARTGDRPTQTMNAVGLSDEEDADNLHQSMIIPHTDKRGKHGNIKRFNTSHYRRKKNTNKSFIRSVSSVSVQT